MLDTDLETICWLILKLREVEVSDVLPPEPADDDETLAPDAVNPLAAVEVEAAGEGRGAAEDPLVTEARRVIDEQNEDARAELVALAWMGRGDYTGIQEWPEAVRTARARHTGATSAYLLGMPLAPDYLEAGLGTLGLRCEGTRAWSS